MYNHQWKTVDVVVCCDVGFGVRMYWNLIKYWHSWVWANWHEPEIVSVDLNCKSPLLKRIGHNHKHVSIFIGTKGSIYAEQEKWNMNASLHFLLSCVFVLMTGYYKLLDPNLRFDRMAEVYLTAWLHIFTDFSESRSVFGRWTAIWNDFDYDWPMLFVFISTNLCLVFSREAPMFRHYMQWALQVCIP